MDRLTKIPTSKILLWLSMVSMVMVFAGLTSGYIVRQAEGNWFVFELPQMFTYSTIVIVLSSVTMWWAVRSVRKGDLVAMRTSLAITLILGLGFCITQFWAWSDLVKMGIFFTGNPSGSFLYVLSALHLAHLAGGILYMIIVTTNAFRGLYSPENHLQIELCSTFWHFMDGLWVYLFIFLTMIR
ncbi:MAG: heme-copper oxidase subunit III [Bacteroidota bacterium]